MWRLISLLLFSLLLVVVQSALCLEGKVVSVSDGDTITVLTPDTKPVKVRLHGIDCPESNQAFGTKAKQFTSELVYGERVSVTQVATDKYKRLVGIVELENGQILNELLVAAGVAWWYQQYAPTDRTLQSLEEAARKEKKGIWSVPNPTPPWEFRHPKLAIADPLIGVHLPIIGNRNSKIFHPPGCPDYSKVSPKNRVNFGSENDAIKAGYRRAKNC